MVRTMESGQGSLDELCSTLGAVEAQAFVRVAMQAGSHAVWYVDAVVAPPCAPAGWQPVVWEYEPVTFAAAEVSARALAAALDRDDAQVLPLGAYNLTLPFSPTSSVGSAGRAARATTRFFSLADVFRSVYRPGSPQQQTPSGYLIGDDCPSFPSYEAAFRAFFYADYVRSSAGSLPSGFGDVRVVEGTAWFERVVVTPTSLEVQIGGRDFIGVRVELNGATYRTDARVSKTGQVQLPLPDGLPAGAWLYLSRDRRWLDYRPLGDYRAHTDFALAGVEVELPHDPDAEIQALLARGEGQQIEFKSQLPEVFGRLQADCVQDGSRLREWGWRQHRIWGAKDEATVCGLDGIDPLRERDRLAQLARSIVTPAPAVEVRQYDVDGKLLLVLSVEPGSNQPYGITLPGKKDKPVEFYVRRDATTFPARSEEIRNAVLASAPQPAADPPWGYQG